MCSIVLALQRAENEAARRADAGEVVDDNESRPDEIAAKATELGLDVRAR
jgi:hypothetical protein